MLSLNVQSGSTEPEWVEIKFKDEIIRITAFKKGTMMPSKSGGSSVVMFIKCENKNVLINRTGEYMERKSGKTINTKK